jgi:hypothetical protein
MPEELRKEATARAERAKAWLLEATPATTEDFTFRLNDLARTGASHAERAAAVHDLRGLQGPNAAGLNCRAWSRTRMPAAKYWWRFMKPAACRPLTRPGAGEALAVSAHSDRAGKSGGAGIAAA